MLYISFCNISYHYFSCHFIGFGPKLTQNFQAPKMLIVDFDKEYFAHFPCARPFCHVPNATAQHSTTTSDIAKRHDTF